jgi:hypothetical protein
MAYRLPVTAMPKMLTGSWIGYQCDEMIAGTFGFCEEKVLGNDTR